MVKKNYRFIFDSMKSVTAQTEKSTRSSIFTVFSNREINTLKKKKKKDCPWKVGNWGKEL